MVFGIGLAASIVEQNQVHFLRTVQLFAAARTGNHVEISSNVLTDGRTRQQAVQRRNIRQLGYNFFNTGNGDMHGWNSGTQATVAFVFHQTQRTCFCNSKVYAAQTNIGSAVNIAQCFTGEAGQLVYVVR